MPRPATDKRERLAAAALDLTYRKGFEATSISDIATHANISAGSVYYYFKTKDDVAAAVLDTVQAQFAQSAAEWDELPDHRDRLLAYVQTYADDSERISEWGCPVGTVVADLEKQGGDIALSARAVMEGVVEWAATQFEGVGFASAAARTRALHLVSVIQGAAALAKALGDPSVVRQETDHLDKWLRRASTP